EHVGELLVGQPMVNVDRDPVHFRDRGIGAADREQRHDPERPCQGQERIAVLIHEAARLRATMVTARLSGIATSSTAGNGSRASPIAMNTAIITTSATRSRRLTRGSIILKTTEIRSPTAAQETPARIRRSASTWPKCA